MISLEKGKLVKTKRYTIRNSKAGVHEYLQTVFEGQYYGLANIMVHSACLDYRLRMSQLQLFEFSRLSPADKKKLLDRNRKMQSKEVSYLGAIAKQLKMPEDEGTLRAIEDIVVRDIKGGYNSLLKEYSHLFSRVITEQHRKQFSQLVVHPSQLVLFEDESKGTWKEQSLKSHKGNSLDQAVERMLNESNLVSGELIKLWHHFVDLLKMSPRFSTAHY